MHDHNGRSSCEAGIWLFIGVGHRCCTSLRLQRNADITGYVVPATGHYVEVVDGFGAPRLQRLPSSTSGWKVDDATDTVLNNFNVNMFNSLGDVTYYQSFTGATWLPNNQGPPFETEALRHADSFVSMGGRTADLTPSYGCNNRIVQMNNNGTGLDPNFGGNNADRPGADAAWYNSNPENYIGSPVDGVVFIGRFAMNGVQDFGLSGTLGVTWNNGIGTEGRQEHFPIGLWGACDSGEGVFDCNENGIPDSCDIDQGTSEDADGDGVPDECQDCNDNGIYDGNDIANGTSADCNLNQVPDECELPTSVFTASEATIPTTKSPLEISCPTDALAVTDTLIEITATGDFGSIAEFLVVSLNGETVGYLFSSDGGDCTEATGVIAINAAQWNGAGKIDTPVVGIVASAAVDPDECASSAIEVVVTVETEYPDCNENGTWDECDIASGNSADCNTNGRPDECDIGDEIKEDCNGNGVIDFCELDETTDCNNNGRFDTCDLAEGIALDCNGNQVPDFCDIADGKFDDNDNRIPDSCDLARGDLDLDGCVGGGDLGVLLSLWGFPDPPIGDLDGDGVISGGDLGILLLNWERCP